jgi:tagatose 6-phosphate kinase
MIICLGPTPAVQRVMVFNSLAIDAVNRATEVVEGAAGKSINVAKVLTALGGQAIELGFVGGQRGEFLISELDRLGVPHDLVTVKAPTRLCITVIDQATAAHTELVEESRPVPVEAYEALSEKLTELLPQARLLILSGSLTPAAPHDFYQRCVRLASSHHVPVILDAQGAPLISALPAGPAVVKPNRAELAATVQFAVDTDLELRRAVGRLIELGAQYVVVTMGKEGAIAADGKAFWRIYPPRIRAVNPIGSGDAFTAGLASALADGKELAEACRFASACGTANTLTLMAGEVRPEDVRLLLDQIKVEVM